MGEEGLDMSLDDIITSRRRGGGQGRGGSGQRRGGAGSGPVRRGRGGGGGGFRPTPYSRPSSDGGSGGQWQHDMFSSGGRGRQGFAGAASGGLRTGGVLLVSNLHYAVSNQDMHELFEPIGEVKSARVRYDDSGRSLGIADVVMARRADAVAALQQYNGLTLDGQIMKVEFPSGSVGASASSGRGFSRGGGSGFRGRLGGGGGGSYNSGFGGGYNKGGYNSSRGGGGFRGRGRGRGRGQGRGGSGKSSLSREELDAELDAYQSQVHES